MPLPAINVSGKVWFAHRHKAAGHSVAAELNDIVAGGCASLTCCTTQHAELAQLRDWWLSPEPMIAAYPALRGKHAGGTTCLTNEDELLPLLWHLNASRPPGARHAPAIVTMYRHPASRCRSHWAHMRDVCVAAQRSPRVAWLQAHINGGANAGRCELYPPTREGGRRFAETFCRHSFIGDWESHGIPSPQAAYGWMKSHVAFWGLLEHYTSSLCLLWAQAGLRERLAECSCAESNASSVGHHLGFVSGRFSRGVPSSLNLTDEEIVHPPDLALYRLLEKGLEERVREVEQSTGLKLWCGERGPS